MRTAATPMTADAGSRQKWWDDELRLGRVLLFPTIAYIVALVGIPFVLAIVYSVSDISVGSTRLHYVGLRNFARIVQDPTFLQSLLNATIFTLVSQALVVVLAKVLAMALYRDFPGRWLVRLLILLPWVAPISLSSIAWLWIFDPVYSIINWSARALHIFGPGVWPIWLGQPDLAMASVILVNVWRLLPLATVIILAGLSAIPQDIHDAAQVDGAGFWRHLFLINLPLVMPIMLVALLFGVVFTFTDLIVVFVLTRGGPFDTTQVIASYAFFTGIEGGDLASGAAISLFLFPVLMAAAIAFLTIARRAEVA
jgi:multiple sugar transport system permease protein